MGDWVLVTPDDCGTGPAIIQNTLERETRFSRKEAGEGLDEQVIAANIDTVFIVTGLDNNFNLGRIERYLLLTLFSGAQPVIVLNKADLCKNLPRKVKLVSEIAMNAPIHTVSALHPTDSDKTLLELKKYLREGSTAAVLGSSGVGKSTLINHLLGYAHFQTGEVRALDSKGRHTTTHRELCVVDGGGLIIDTPGMREIQFWADERALSSSFDDITNFASECQFNDCQHRTEPNCAINLAIKTGQLDVNRLATYKKFQTELSEFSKKVKMNHKKKQGNRSPLQSVSKSRTKNKHKKRRN